MAGTSVAVSGAVLDRNNMVYAIGLLNRTEETGKKSKLTLITNYPL